MSAPRVAEAGDSDALAPGCSTQAFLDAHKFGASFREDYLAADDRLHLVLPDRPGCCSFLIATLIRFCANHGSA